VEELVDDVGMTVTSFLCGARPVVLLFMNAMVLAKPEVFIGLVNTKFDANRQCTRFAAHVHGHSCRSRSRAILSQPPCSAAASYVD
jgi:hypothetical protein